MPIPLNVLANADDFGLNNSVNKAIVFCFERKYINSASIITNTPGFDEAVAMIHKNSFVSNIGLHVNFAEGMPLTQISSRFTETDGSWDLKKTNKLLNFLNGDEKAMFLKETEAQIERALSHRISLKHIDSHYHLHTLPAFSNLFLTVAKKYNLKLRLAQTYREGSYPKFWYRRVLNNKMTGAGLNYSKYFETVDFYLANKHLKTDAAITEVMLHPGLDAEGELTDHYDAATMANWLNYLNKQ